MTENESYGNINAYIPNDVYQNKELLGTSWRSKLMEALVRFHYKRYSRSHYKNRQAWGLSLKDLFSYPKGSLGYELGSFLRSNNFNLIPKFENHDVFHVVLSYTPLVTDEIRMQCCLVGSGRRTASTFATVIIGAVFYPEYLLEFIKAYKRGLTLSNFSHQEFKPSLETPLIDFKNKIGC